ncbi:MAG: ROK family protein [Candidatus Coatesbacteria bacterium]
MSSLLEVTPKHVPPLDPGFRPASLGTRAYLAAVKASGQGVPLVLGLRREGAFSVFKTQVFAPGSAHDADTLRYVERTVKFMLWQKGGHTIVVGGAHEIADHLRKAYAPGGSRAFDAEFMSRDVYEHAFGVEHTTPDQVPASQEPAAPKGGHLDGCRIGLDLGASDRKVAAVIDGKAVYSEEVIWNPKTEKDPEFHYREIRTALKAAASHMPRVDAIGVSSAGIYINNRAMIASLFRGIPKDLFASRIKPIFLNIRKEFNNVPLEVCNDGDVTALAGAMNLKSGAVLGVAMGSSEAAGYVTRESYLTDWLSELAFAPVDFRTDKPPVDEWSGEAGCGVQYFSQVAAIRLAEAAGIPLQADASPAEKLKAIQELMPNGHPKIKQVFESIGCFLGYAIAHYADFYEIKNLLILGRVTSGEGGVILLAKAREVLKDEFPQIAGSLEIHIPEEESDRRVGQAVAAASLPSIPKKA